MGTALRVAALLVVLLPSVALAHHGSGISYDINNLWTTWATVTEFNFLNPHPTMTFDRKTKDGKVEHWRSELLTNPSVLARAGWTKGPQQRRSQAGHTGEALSWNVARGWPQRHRDED